MRFRSSVGATEDWIALAIGRCRKPVGHSDGTFVALAGPGTVKDCGESEVSLRMHEASCR